MYCCGPETLRIAASRVGDSTSRILVFPAWTLRCPLGISSLAEGTPMTRQPSTTRFGQALVSATIGAICGGMLASFGHVISSSTTVVIATIIGGAVLGGWLSRFWGAVNGALISGMLTAVGSVIGGSLIRVLCTITLCALLGGWLRWRSQERGDSGVTLLSQPRLWKHRQVAEFASSAGAPGARHSLAAAAADDHMWLRWDGFQTPRTLL
jgi:hypothetical protein